jgi:hypothetical protein
MRIFHFDILAGMISLLMLASANAVDPINPAFLKFHPEKYERPYGPKAAWNIPLKGIAKHPNSALLADKHWNFSPDRAGNFNLAGFDSYSYPVYQFSDATSAYPVVLTNPTWGNLHQKTLPWNPAKWTAAAGSDGQIIIIDPRTGREWNLWQVTFDGTTVTASNGNLVKGDYRTKEDGFTSSRGCGIQYLAMLTRPEEIMLGEIRHALSMPIKNSGTTFAPPATKTDGKTTDGIPEGTRFGLNVTDAQIDQWIQTLPSDTMLRYSARVIAVALREYGWVITDTSGAAGFQFEYNGTAAEKWAALGLSKKSINGKVYPQDLLDGLLTKDRIYAVVPSDQYPSTP